MFVLIECLNNCKIFRVNLTMEHQNSFPEDGFIANCKNTESFTTSPQSVVSIVEGKSELSTETVPKRQQMAAKCKKIIWPPRGRWAKYLTYSEFSYDVLLLLE